MAACTNTLGCAPDAMEVRKAIITLAQSMDGSHYLWGSAGNIPDQRNGSPYRPMGATMVPSDRTLDKLAIFAAKCESGGHFVCCGRWASIFGGRRYESGDKPKLQEYLRNLKDGDEANWPLCYQGYTPSQPEIGPVGPAGGWAPRKAAPHGEKPWIVFGEDCRNKRHFDCIHFINYCYIMTVQGFGPDDLSLAQKAKKDMTPDEVKASGKGQYSIGNWQLDNNLGKVRKFSDGPITDLIYADVLSRHVDKVDSEGNPYVDEHIGLYDGNGGVVQAADSVRGVLTAPYSPAGWTYVCRVPDEKMQPRPDAASDPLN